MFKVGDEILVKGRIEAIMTDAGVPDLYHVMTSAATNSMWVKPDELVAVESGRVFDVVLDPTTRAMNRVSDGLLVGNLVANALSDEQLNRLRRGCMIILNLRITEVEPEEPLSTEERIASLEKRIAELEGGK